MERATLKKFLGKRVGLLYCDSGRDIFRKGTLTWVGESDIILNCRFGKFAISLAEVKTLKTVEGEYD